MIFFTPFPHYCSDPLQDSTAAVIALVMQDEVACSMLLLLYIFDKVTPPIGWSP